MANAGPSTKASRRWCIVLSLAPDVDGLSLLAGRDAYLRWHHVIAHNFLFIGILTLVSIRWVGWRPLQLARIYACGLLHFLGDYWGSGPGWALYPLLPFSNREVLNPRAWDFNGVESQIVLGLCILATVGIAKQMRRTPLEPISEWLEKRYFPGMGGGGAE